MIRNDLTDGNSELIKDEIFQPLSNERRLFTIPDSIGGFSTLWYEFFPATNIKDDSYALRFLQNDEFKYGIYFPLYMNLDISGKGDYVIPYNIINHTAKAVEVKIKIKPLCQEVLVDKSSLHLPPAGYLTNISTYTFDGAVIDHSHGVRVSCGNRKCSVEMRLCSSTFDPKINDAFEYPAVNDCFITYSTPGDRTDSRSTVIPVGGTVFVPDNGIEVAFPMNFVFPNTLFFNPPQSPKLFTGKLVVCQTGGDNNLNIDEENLTIEPNISW